MTNLKKRTPVSADSKWFEIYDTDGNCFGKIKAKHQNLKAPAWSLAFMRAFDQLTQSEQIRIDNPKTDADVLLKRRLLLSLLVSNYVTDSALLDDEGNAVEHNEATVLGFLIDPENWDLAQDFDKAVSNPSNFRVEQAAKDAKKN